MLRALGRAIAARPGLIVLVWIVLTIAGFAAATGTFGEGLFARLNAGEATVSSESSTGREILNAASTTGPSVSLLVKGAEVTDPLLADPLTAARTDLLAIPGVAQVVDPLAVPGGPSSPAGAALVAKDGNGFLVSVTLEPDLPGDVEDSSLTAVQDRLAALSAEISGLVPGATGQVGGGTLLFDAITGQVEKDLVRGELIALPVSLLVMVLVFGGFMAAGMPIMGAIASIGGALAALLAFSYLIDLDAAVVNVVTVLGLGLCIDYGLLIVSRYREELREKLAANTTRSTKAARTEALVGTMVTAGRTVLFSGVTVAISLSGLLLFEARILRAVGAAGVSVVVIALLVAMTLVPALLALSGTRMVKPGLLSRIPGLRSLTKRFGDVAPEVGFFSGLATWTQRRPWLVVGGVLLVLGILAAPVLRLELRSSGAQLLPPSAPDRQFFDTLGEQYPASGIPTIQVVGEATAEQMAPLAEEIAGMDGVELVAPPRPVGETHAVVNVFMADPDPGSAQAKAVVADIRDSRPDYPIWVTGQTAALIDFTHALATQAPRAMAVVILATFVLLFLLTGSILVPIKALLINIVSLGASLGVLVWVFQDGNGEALLGFQSTGGIETIIPILVIALGFGLAMDYEVFLLSRIKEFRDKGMNNNEAVVAGLQRSGRIITSAALIVVLVFSGFVAGELLVIKQTGVALAVAVAVDATLVRCLLVPATMTLLGEWNWWAPAPLRRLHDRLGLRH
ncbi:MMPL family transporter [Nakamurella sp. GG22]